MAWMAAAGGALKIAGDLTKGFVAEDARDDVKKIAETPGIDVDALTGEALAMQLKYLPPGSELSKRISTINQANLNAQEESALPGVGAARQKALGGIMGLFSEDSEWLKGLKRRGAALGLSSGLRGSAAGQIGALRLSDQESMARKQLGTSLLGSLISSMRIANTPGVQSFLGPNSSDLINIRSQERAQKMNILLGRAKMPTMMSTYADSMSEAGGMLMGAGMMGGMSGGSSTGGTGGWSGGGISSGPGSATGGWGGS